MSLQSDEVNRSKNKVVDKSGSTYMPFHELCNGVDDELLQT